MQLEYELTPFFSILNLSLSFLWSQVKLLKQNLISCCFACYISWNGAEVSSSLSRIYCSLNEG